MSRHNEKPNAVRPQILSQKVQTAATTAAILFLSIIFIVTGAQTAKGFLHLGNADLMYDKGVVVETDNSQLTPDPADPKRSFGLQLLKIRLTEGELAGQTVEVQNYLLSDYNINPAVGETVIVSIDNTGEYPYCLLFNYNRSPALFALVAFFVFVLLAVGGAKGLRAALGLAFTLVTVVFFTIPMIYEGHSPIWIALLTAALTTCATLFLLNGFHRKTLAAILSCCTGLLFAGLLYTVFAAAAKINGYNTAQAGSLAFFANHTALQVRHVLFAGVLIATLGAVMDVGMSIASAMHEVNAADPDRTVRQLYCSGLAVAKDMIGTMSNTLILAFTGGSLSTLIAMAGYGIQFQQIMNSDFIAVEIVQGLTASSALIITAPIASLFSALIYKGKVAPSLAAASSKQGKT